MRHWSPYRTFQSYRKLRRTGRFDASPPAVLAMGFLALIAIGTALLCLPPANAGKVDFFAALFTATSAVTVTGLSIVELGTQYTPLGHTIIALLAQAGGLGFATFAILAAISLGKKISLKQQAVALEAFNQTSLSKIQHTALAVFKITLLIEGTAILILTLHWWQHSPFTDALFNAVFHTIAAFNNAGFTLPATELVQYVSDPVVILTTTLLIILGGLGFTVLNDAASGRSWARLMPYTRLILTATLVLNLLGFGVIWALEWNNPQTLGPLTLKGQMLAAWLQSVAARTAGFSSIDVAHITDGSALVTIMLMFIGGGSLSTASGIKLGTFVVLLAAARSYITQRNEVVLMNRAIPQDTVQKSLALLLVTLGLALFALLLMTIFERAPFIDLAFETISALSTTGMSRGLTPSLSTPSQILLLALMFAGRIGPLTLIYSLATQTRSRIRYPETDIPVG